MNGTFGHECSADSDSNMSGGDGFSQPNMFNEARVYRQRSEASGKGVALQRTGTSNSITVDEFIRKQSSIVNETKVQCQQRSFYNGNNRPGSVGSMLYRVNLPQSSISPGTSNGQSHGHSSSNNELLHNTLSSVNGSFSYPQSKTTVSEEKRPAPSFMGQQQPDYRIHELNKRLQQRNEESDNLWWDAFATEFFEDDASLTLTFCLEDGPKRYTIGRTLIPRYFRSIFEGGVTDLHYVLKHSKESFHNTTISLDCEQASMVTQHGKPLFPYVITEGRLLLEFTFDDLMRIRSWHFAIRQHRELIPRSAMMQQPVDPTMMEQMSKNITRQGLTNYTLNFLRLCVILEPMQELMSRHKAYGLNPRDCLKTTLFQKWQRMVAPVGKESARPPSKRRKRKASSSNNSGAGNNNNRDVPPSGKQKRSPGPHGFNIGSSVPGGEKKKSGSGKKKQNTEELTQNTDLLHSNGLAQILPVDVMVVGEPTLMGGEFGDEDERLITRLENNQFEGTGAGPEDDGTEQKFSNSPAWGQGDKKTPPTSSAAGPPPPSANSEPEIKTE